MTDKESRPEKPAKQPEKPEEATPGNGYPLTYWVNKQQSICLVRVSDIRIQGWKPFGRDLTKDFEHSHFQTTYPTKDRLDEYLKDFAPSTVNEYLEYQFAQHQLDDYFREKANQFKNKLASA